MNFISIVFVNIFSVTLLACIYFQTIHDAAKNMLQHQLYKRMVQVNILLLIVDIFSRFDGRPGTAYVPINHAANFLVFAMNLFIPSLWLLYAAFQVTHNKRRLKRLAKFLAAVNIVNVVMQMFSLFFGWFYYIDAGNYYHRGPLYWLPVSVTFALTAAAFILICANYRKIERKYFLSLLFFPIPPVVCVILQITNYGTSFILSGMTLSLLIVFLNIQNHSMNIDYLTGAYNRRGLEMYMRERINASSADKTFSAIWIDLDDFKYINDTFGHNTGDQLLETSVRLLRRCFRPTDFIARFGGDEFCVILDISNSNDLEAAAARIKDCVKSYNDRSENPYTLSMSMGYAVYDCRSHMKTEEFQKLIDGLMYKDKQAKKRSSL